MKKLFLVSLAGFFLATSYTRAAVTQRPLFEDNMKMMYDAHNRLTNVVHSNGQREVYAYDAVGNRLLKQVFGPPEIDVAPEKVVLAGVRSEMPFTVTHLVLPITNITVKAFTSNRTLLGTNAPPVFGMGTNRFVVIHPAKELKGIMSIATISLVASDGFVSSTNYFTVVVEAEKQQ